MSCDLDPAELTQRVLLQRPPVGVDARGQAVGAYTDVREVWAKVEPMRGRDFFAAAQVQSTIDVRFTLRFAADIEATWRVVWQGKPYEIIGQPINVGGRGIKLELMCVQGVRSGRA